MILTSELLKAAMPMISDVHIGQYLQPINDTLEKYEINAPLRIAHWLAQVGHESLNFIYTEELADGSAYEGRKDLGNIVVGDGKFFKGRGIIQLTGRTIYEEYGKYVDFDFTSAPKALAALPYSVDSAGWFWSIYKKINPLADQDSILGVTKKVNGGLNGFSDRKQRLFIAKKALGVGIAS